MTIYLVQFAIILLLSLLPKRTVTMFKKEYNSDLVLLCISFFLITFVMCLRDPTVGTDTMTYTYVYQKIASASSLSQAFQNASLSAPVYVVIVFLLSRIFNSPQVMIVVSSFLICYGLFRSIKLTSKKYTYSVQLLFLLTIYFWAFNGARQMLSVAMAINAYWLLQENLKSIKGWILFLLAIGTHNTAIFFFVSFVGVWIANKTKDEKRLFITITVMSIIATSFLGEGINLFTRFLPRYAMYVNGINPESIIENIGGGRIALLYFLLLMIVIIYLMSSRRSILQGNVLEKRALPSLVFCCVCGIVFARNTLIQRMLWYYQILFVTCIPDMILNLPKKYRIFVWWVLFVGLFVCLFICISSYWKTRVQYYHISFFGITKGGD